MHESSPVRREVYVTGWQTARIGAEGDPNGWDAVSVADRTGPPRLCRYP